MWLRDLLLNHPNLTKYEVRRKILEIPDFSCIFMSRHLNYNSVLNEYFKNKPIEKSPYWGVFHIPYELKKALDYLDEWVRRWYNKEVRRGERPRPIFISGKGNCGKTSLICSLGSFSYWCTNWNFSNYQAETSFNFFDDYDRREDFKGNSSDNSWAYLKPWIGGQDVIYISGKFKSPIIVTNNRPCVFV